jgi:translation initiation factor 1
MSICQTCGLPDELCVCESIAKETQKIEIGIERKKYNKKYTVISGFDKDIDVKDIGKKLKEACACGGTSKGNVIELQGDHVMKVKKKLIKLGFAPDGIIIRK